MMFYDFLYKKSNLRYSFIIFIVFLIISGVVVTFFNNFSTFYNAPISPIKSLSIKDSIKEDLWPNVYTTVSELNEASIPKIIEQIGGKFFFVIALLGIFLIMLDIKKEIDNDKRESNRFQLIFFIIWFFGTIFISTKGIRFILLLVPVFAILFGITIGKSYKFICDWLSIKINVNKKIINVIVMLVFLLFLIIPFKSAHNIMIHQSPSMNDAWYESLNKIRLESSSDAIITSWWDFGHWFKAIGDRAVTFDGASQNTPMAHWIGRSLLTNNEDESIGILRMLDCGSNDAFEEFKSSGVDTVTSIDILYELLTSNKLESARILENNGINKDTAEKVLSLTQCNPPENYFITSQDMIGKSGVWAHFGSWDFKKALIWQEYRELSKEDFENKAIKLGFNETEATQMYYEVKGLVEGRAANDWIAPWPSYASRVSGCQEKDNMLFCSTGLIVNLSTMDAYISTRQGNFYPKKLSYVNEEGNFAVKEYEKGKILSSNNGYIGASLLKSGNSYQSILMNSELVDSMFNRLFYYEGIGLSHFEEFSDVTGVIGSRIIVWKVKWEE